MIKTILKSLVLSSVALFSTANAQMKFSDKPTSVKVEQKSSDNSITLTKHNHVVLRGEVTGQSISKLIVELNNLKTDEPIIFISSPGGSVMAGNALVEYILNSNRKITCVVDYGYSMGFVILQACHRRIAMHTSTAMQHQASFGVEGSTENLKASMNFVLRMLEKMDVAQAMRIGISVEEFRKRILSDWWLVGDDIVKSNVADTLMAVRCESELTLEEKKFDIMTMFGTVNVTFSACPLARSPIEVSFSFYDTDKQVKAYDQIMSLTDPSKAKSLLAP